MVTVIHQARLVSVSVTEKCVWWLCANCASESSEQTNCIGIQMVSSGTSAQNVE